MLLFSNQKIRPVSGLLTPKQDAKRCFHYIHQPVTSDSQESDGGHIFALRLGHHTVLLGLIIFQGVNFENP